MVTPLCEDETPDCLGLPTANPACPLATVVCAGGELKVQGWTAAKAYIVGSGETVNLPALDATVINSTILELPMVNPWCTDAIVWVSHEFGATIEISDTDNWSVNGDVNIVGGLLLSGGTTGQFTLLGRDGTAFANDNTLPVVVTQQTFAMPYVVAANAAFTVSQLTRVEALDIRGASRNVVGFTNAIKALVMPRQS